MHILTGGAYRKSLYNKFPSMLGFLEFYHVVAKDKLSQAAFK